MGRARERVESGEETAGGWRKSRVSFLHPPALFFDGRCRQKMDVNALVTLRANAAGTASGTHQSVTGRLTSTACHISFGQPHGGSLRAKAPANAPPTPRTFGAKHSRGLPPNGLEVFWNPVNRRVKTREGEAPAEPANTGPRSKRLPAILRCSGDRRSPRGRDAAQQELRPPGTPSCQKVKAIGLPSGGSGLCDAAQQEIRPGITRRREHGQIGKF